MGEQLHRQPSRQEDQSAEIDNASIIEKSEEGAELVSEIDKLLEEIDATLEENAEEFVKNFQQQNGQ